MGKPSEEKPKRRKKKGRPSLLDLQKRNLRLQTQNPNPNTNPNPYLGFPQPAPTRRSTRRNPVPSPPPAAADDDDDEDEDGSSGGERRREKKLRLVLRLPHDHCFDSDSAAESGKRRIRAKTHSPALKGIDALQGEPLDSGPTTPLPDKKLLLFILDRLQKKDTYGVFSEPVDPDELPDYFDIIDHPMDFGTVRKKLSDGAYQNLEQFEKDIFLISSNAMTYNAPDTIYYRQARAIQELAKKNFENLRQESDGNESEPKAVRRGRPPGKNTNKWTAGKSTDRAASCFSSNAILADARDNGQMSNLANDLSRKASSSDKPGVADICTRNSYGLRNSASCRWIKEHKSERTDENTGSTLKGVSTKYGKKTAVVDEKRRNTYQPPLSGGSMHESLYLFTFDGRKQLLPVGLHMEHAYAKSLAQFVANLGPKVWEIAARRIQRALPPGTKFGRGWVGDSEAPQQFQPPIPCYSPQDPPELKPSISTLTSRDNKPPERPEPPYTNPAVEESHSSRITSAYPNRSSDGMEGAEPGTTSRPEGRFILPSGASGFQPNSPFQLHQPPVVQPRMSGLDAAVFGFDSLGQAGKVLRPIRPPEKFNLEAPVTHGGVLDMVSSNNDRFSHETPKSHLDDEKLKAVGNRGTTAPNRPLPDTSHDFHGPWQESSRPVSGPPDLNVSFQSPSSPASGLVVESQQPDLALQL